VTVQDEGPNIPNHNRSNRFIEMSHRVRNRPLNQNNQPGPIPHQHHPLKDVVTSADLQNEQPGPFPHHYHPRKDVVTGRKIGQLTCRTSNRDHAIPHHYHPRKDVVTERKIGQLTCARTSNRDHCKPATFHILLDLNSIHIYQLSLTPPQDVSAHCSSAPFVPIIAPWVRSHTSETVCDNCQWNLYILHGEDKTAWNGERAYDIMPR
jgi:hypothetical protein